MFTRLKKLFHSNPNKITLSDQDIERLHDQCEIAVRQAFESDILLSVESSGVLNMDLKFVIIPTEKFLSYQTDKLFEKVMEMIDEGEIIDTDQLLRITCEIPFGGGN